MKATFSTKVYHAVFEGNEGDMAFGVPREAVIGRAICVSA